MPSRSHLCCRRMPTQAWRIKSRVDKNQNTVSCPMTAMAVPIDTQVIDKVHKYETISRHTEIMDRSAKLGATVFHPKLRKKDCDPETKSLDLTSVTSFKDPVCLWHRQALSVCCKSGSFFRSGTCPMSLRVSTKVSLRVAGDRPPSHGFRWQIETERHVPFHVSRM